MALLIADGFGCYGSSQIGTRWDNWNYASIGTTTGRFGGGALNVAGGSGAYIYKGFTPSSVVVAGFAHNQSFSGNFCQIYTGTTSVLLTIGGQPSVCSVSVNGVSVGTGTTNTRLGYYYYYEVKFKVHNTDGGVWLKINGADELKLGCYKDTPEAMDTQGDSSTVNVLRFYGTIGESSYFDDLYLVDDQGSYNTDFLGDLKVETIYPTGAGTTTQLTPSTGSNWDCVNETPPVTTDYVESSTSGYKDTYVYGNLGTTSGTVYGVQILPYMAKTDSGTRSMVSIARLSGTEEDSANRFLTSSALYYPDIRETKPGGGTWSITNVNDAEFGAKVTA